MPDIKLIAMDMDGTLLGAERGVIPADNLAALREASRRGIHLCLASGRAADDAGFHAVDAGLNMHILALNGAVILHQPLGPVISSVFLPEASARHVYSAAMEAKLLTAVFCEHEVIVCIPNGYDADVKISWGTFMEREGGRTRTRIDRSALASRMDRVSKFVVYAPHAPEAIHALRQHLENAHPELEICSSWAGNIEVNAPGVNKGAALRRLADSLGIPMSQVMALGDNGNDVSMLQAAGYGVAMGNASSDALAAARYVTLPCQECGVAAAIRSLAFGEDVSGVKPTESY